MLLLIAALFGLCLGSFFNVIIARWGREDGIVTGRSHCPNCRRSLPWHDLIPLLSYLLLGARCRYCRQPISLRYPVIETVTAIALVLFAYRYGIPNTPQEIFFLILAIGFLLLLYFDAIYYLLPDIIVGTLLAVTLAYLIIWNLSGLSSHILSGLLLSFVFAILYVVSRGWWIGFGDVKLTFVIGLAFGYPFGFLAVIGAIWAGAILGIILMAIRQATGKTRLPFGSFLAGSGIILILYYHVFQTFRWYF